MKTIPIALNAHYQGGPPHTLAYGISFTRTDGVTKRATSHDTDIDVGGDTYYAGAGGKFTDAQSSSALSVDNAEFTAMLSFFDEDELQAGIYDYAGYQLIRFNYLTPSDGVEIIKTGRTGQYTLDRLTFLAELRGLTQALQQSFGRTATPTCPYILGDDKCTKDLTAFKVTGTADSVSGDGLTWFDAARAEAGPGGAIAITSITNANPAVVTTATPLTQANGTALVFSQIVGPVALNGVHQISNKSGSSFEINVDTTDTGDFPAFVSGQVEPIVSDAGYFGYGLHKITSGANGGLSREIKISTVGQWTLQENFPYPVTGTETYELTAGDDHTAETCRVKFSNLPNFGGFPFVPGQDSQMEVGRRQ